MSKQKQNTEYFHELFINYLEFTVSKAYVAALLFYIYMYTYTNNL